jgi:exodeoxyribonuclease VII small subunit
MPRKKTDKQPNFEESLNALEALVAHMESGELTLEESLQEFERGMALTKQCQKLLDEAEQRVHILTEKGTLETFSGDNDDD